MKRKIKICTIIGAIFFLFLIVYKYIMKADKKENNTQIITGTDDHKTIILGRKYTKLS
ncbi:hypothetical protein [Abyssisolibacter fermentans]|uniref:hypothetical protein n=1 Tax=Abyssisolibacter fermentans TaxID=1766203 RepID=UPI0012E3A9FF|nr:hypothetical protein [Abyssisolibacter fermentans]